MTNEDFVDLNDSAGDQGPSHAAPLRLGRSAHGRPTPRFRLSPERAGLLSRLRPGKVHNLAVVAVMLASIPSLAWITAAQLARQGLVWRVQIGHLRLVSLTDAGTRLAATAALPKTKKAPAVDPSSALGALRAELLDEASAATISRNAIAAGFPAFDPVVVDVALSSLEDAGLITSDGGGLRLTELGRRLQDARAATRASAARRAGPSGDVATQA